MEFEYVFLRDGTPDVEEENHVFIDRASEKGMPAFGQLLERVGQNDLVKVPSMFDLGATMSQIVDSINQISEKGARIWINNDERILDAESEFFQGIRFAVESEREIRSQIHLKAVKTAQNNGSRLGRKPKDIPDNFSELYEAFINGRTSSREAAARLDVSHTTFLRWGKQLIAK